MQIVVHTQNALETKDLIHRLTNAVYYRVRRGDIITPSKDFGEYDDMLIVQSTALALEYQRDYGNASRHLDITDLIYDPAGKSPIRIFGLSFQEQSFNVRFAQSCTLSDYGADPLLVGLDRAEPLS